MIVLDTNVISEMMRDQPDARVMHWVRGQPRESLRVASVSQAEVFGGIGLMPEGRRRSQLAALAQAIFFTELADCILPFDSAAAVHYVAVTTRRREAGRPIDAFDALIAATALAAGAGVATRDIGGFEGCGLLLIDPWS